MNYYIVSCLFTARFPECSLKIQKYLQARKDVGLIRCCTPNFRIEFNEQRIKNTEVRNAWSATPVFKQFAAEDKVYSICHNCTNILEESQGCQVFSLWELIDQDESFVLPDYSGMVVTLQDCWRSRERTAEHEAVRNLLTKMNIQFLELEENREKTDFCGSTLYRKQLPRNAEYAPKHYVENAEGKFLPHSEEEQLAIMQEYCKQFSTQKVVCYCHYCLEGLLQGGVDGIHLAQLIFK